MSENKKIRVVWICSVSNPMLRSHLELGLPIWLKVINTILKKKTEPEIADIAIWNTNALKEFEKISDVDLSVIFVHPNMRKKKQFFYEGGIKYYAVNEGDGGLFRFVKNYFFHSMPSYRSTLNRINKIIKNIKPELIHLMGAENPKYSMSILNCSKKIPIITQLQTFLHDPKVLEYKQNELKYQIVCERRVLNRTDYFGSGSLLFPRIVRENLRKDAIFFNTRLMLSEKIDLSETDKQYDFVYFANYVNKDIDLVLEGFVRACKMKPSLILDVVGSTSKSDIENIMSFVDKFGLRDNVRIEGRLPTHDDVLKQIKKSKVALLPLKIDMVSGTIREAMSNGVPVVTTITQATPKLNKDRESVLLSPIGDHDALASNMIRLIDDQELARQLKGNAAITVEEMYGDNTPKAREWVEAYRACIDSFNRGTALPEHVLNNN